MPNIIACILPFERYYHDSIHKWLKSLTEFYPLYQEINTPIDTFPKHKMTALKVNQHKILKQRLPRTKQNIGVRIC